MVTYRQIQAIQDYRFGKHIAGHDDAGPIRRRHAGLRDLLAGQARILGWLGARHPDGRSGPASPAY